MGAGTCPPALSTRNPERNEAIHSRTVLFRRGKPLRRYVSRGEGTANFNEALRPAPARRLQAQSPVVAESSSTWNRDAARVVALAPPPSARARAASSEHRRLLARPERHRSDRTARIVKVSPGCQSRLGPEHRGLDRNGGNRRPNARSSARLGARPERHPVDTGR